MKHKMAEDVPHIVMYGECGQIERRWWGKGQVESADDFKMVAQVNEFENVEAHVGAC